MLLLSVVVVVPLGVGECACLTAGHLYHSTRRHACIHGQAKALELQAAAGKVADVFMRIETALRDEVRCAHITWR